VELLRAELQAEKRKFDEQRDKLLEKAERDGREAVAKARREAEEVIAELRRMALEERGGFKEHRLTEAKRRLDEAEPQLRRRSPAAAPKAKAAVLTPGDEVRVVHLGQKGHVVELSGDEEAIVQMGIMKMKVRRDQLERVGGGQGQAAKPVQRTATTVKRTRDENTRTELDMRGMNLEEALIEADRFLDESFLSNLGQVYLIHGKGTGILRSGMQDYLRRHKHVKAYRYGNYNEGGNGVTIVELK
jgi:DNA mismatch repair protein MutS2